MGNDIPTDKPKNNNVPSIISETKSPATPSSIYEISGYGSFSPSSPNSPSSLNTRYSNTKSFAMYKRKSKSKSIQPTRLKPSASDPHNSNIQINNGVTGKYLSVKIAKVISF